MNRTEFISQLKQLLGDIPGDECEEAIRYYEDYFDDAGFFEEERVIKELGSPEKVARQIKANLYGRTSEEDGEYTDSGYRNPMFEEKYEVSARKEADRESKEKQYSNIDEEEPYTTGTEQRKDRTKIALIVILAILSAPIWLGLLGGVFGIVFGVVGALIGIVFGFGAAFIGLGVAGIVTLGFAIAKFAVSAPAAFIMLGAGFLMIALAFVFLGITLLVVTRLLPAILRAITSLGSKLFNRNRGVAA